MKDTILHKRRKVINKQDRNPDQKKTRGCQVTD